MADRYWVLGTGTWAATGTTRWSASPGGPAGASVPGAADNVFINNSSGTGTITLTLGSCLNFYANSTNSITVAGSGVLTVRGDFYISSAITWTNTATVAAITNGGTISAVPTGGAPPINLTGSALTWNLAANYTLRTLTGTAGTFTLTSGTINLNNFNINCGVFSSNAAAVRVINFGTGNINMLNSAANANILLMASVSSLTCSDSGGGFYTDTSVQRQVIFASTGTGVTIDGAPPNFVVGPGASTITSTGALHVKNLNLNNVAANSAFMTACVMSSVNFANNQANLNIRMTSANYSGNTTINSGGSYFGNLLIGSVYTELQSAIGTFNTTFPLIVNNSATLDFKGFTAAFPNAQSRVGSESSSQGPGFFVNTGTLTFSALAVDIGSNQLNFSNVANAPGNITGSTTFSNSTSGLYLWSGTINYYGTPIDIRGLNLVGTQNPKTFNLYANLIGNTTTAVTSSQLTLGGNTTLNLNGYQMKFGSGVSYANSGIITGSTQYLNFQGGNIIIENRRTDVNAGFTCDMPVFTNFFTDAATTMGNGGFQFGYYVTGAPLVSALCIGNASGITNVSARQNAFNVYMYGNRAANIAGIAAKMFDTNTLGYTGSIQANSLINFQSLNIGTGTTGWDSSPAPNLTCNTTGVVGTITLNNSNINNITFGNTFGSMTFLDSGNVSNFIVVSGSGDITLNTGVTINIGNVLTLLRTVGTGYLNGPGNINLTGLPSGRGSMNSGSANNLGSAPGLPVPNIYFSNVSGSTGNTAVSLGKLANLNGGTYGNIINNSASNLYILNSGTVNDVQTTVGGSRILVGAGVTLTVANFSYSGTPGNPSAIQCNVSGSQWGIYKTNTGNTANIQYANIRDAFITSPYTFFASNNSSGNLGNNQGPWDFGAGASMVQCNMAQFF